MRRKVKYEYYFMKDTEKRVLRLIRFDTLQTGILSCYGVWDYFGDNEWYDFLRGFENIPKENLLQITSPQAMRYKKCKVRYYFIKGLLARELFGWRGDFEKRVGGKWVTDYYDEEGDYVYADHISNRAVTDVNPIFPCEAQRYLMLEKI